MSVSNILPHEALSVRWRDMRDSEHFVQFYEHDAALLDCVTGYVKKSPFPSDPRATRH
jgi:hypothetical protein